MFMWATHSQIASVDYIERELSPRSRHVTKVNGIPHFSRSGQIYKTWEKPKNRIGLWKPISLIGKIFRVTSEANDFIRMNNLAGAVKYAEEMIISSIDEKILYSKPIIEMAKDIEAPQWGALKITVEIQSRNYSEILKIWGDVTKRFYDGLDRDVAKKVYIVMRKKRL